MKKRKIPKNQKGVTLVEVLVAASIFAFCVSGLLLTYMNLLILTDVSRDTTIANNVLQARLEEARTVSFGNLSSWSNSTTGFSVVNNDFLFGGNPIQIGVGNITCTDVADPFTNTTYSDMKKIRVVISFKSRSRVIGEDANLNGQLDAGEDDSRYPSGTGQLDSPVEGVTLIKNFTNSTE
ncbi:MAG: prepilin-type N-terminal cleavage/methylation domain-containing protein [Candidatus Omnitrophica bacterium]|nr:prepilin-type N-terminal cleavage/methylation domain-containing protein [Candidatus Omnitrophota bacterium]